MMTPGEHRSAAEDALAEQEDHLPGDPAHLSLGISAVGHLLTVMADSELAASAGTQPDVTPFPPAHEVSTLNLAPAPWIDDPGVADGMMRALGGAIATAAACGQVTRLVNPDGEFIAAIVPAPGAAGQFGRELRRGMAEGNPLVSEAAQLAAEPKGVQDVVLVHRADLAGFMIWAGYDANDRDPGSTPGRLAQAAFPDPVDDTAGLSDDAGQPDTLREMRET